MRFFPIEIIRTIKDLYFSKSPQYIVFFVTSKCNARCKMCFYWKQIEESSQKQELSLEEIEKISLNLPRFYSLAISGGEPFLRNDLAEICKIFVKNNKIKHLSIPTNGLLTNSISSQTEEICKNSPKTKIEIEFSIDAMAEIHNEIRGVNNIFETAMLSIKKLSSLEKIYPNLRVKVNTTFSKFNQNNLLPLIDFLKNNLKLNRTNISILHGQARVKDSEDYDINLYKKAIDYLIKKQIASEKITLFDIIMISIKHRARELLIKAVEQKKYPLKCWALKKFIVIRETGDVYPCEPINDSLGNLRENNYSLSRLLKSDRAKNFIKNFNPNGCYCTWGCSVLNNILYSPYNLFRALLLSLGYKFKILKRQNENFINQSSN